MRAFKNMYIFIYKLSDLEDNVILEFNWCPAND